MIYTLTSLWTTPSLVHKLSIIFKSDLILGPQILVLPKSWRYFLHISFKIQSSLSIQRAKTLTQAFNILHHDYYILLSGPDKCNLILLESMYNAAAKITHPTLCIPLLAAFSIPHHTNISCFPLLSRKLLTSATPPANSFSESRSQLLFWIFIMKPNF